ncbi:MAG: hypothetical protein LBJ57_01755 [Prevotellaceae bacterium]|jgi:hypothetical protein|nr:hypothetical protein [Prevotellaceae bacterium]
MKKNIFLVFCLAIAASAANAYDVIVKKDGNEIEGYVIKVSDTGVEYRKKKDSSDRTYTLSKSEIFMIKYHNGDKEVFGQKQSTASQNGGQQSGSLVQNNTNFKRKSPGLAFTLSFLIPGLGQIYNGEATTGFGLMAAALIGPVAGYGIFMADPGNSQAQGLGIAICALYPIAWIYSFIDAPKTAAEINRRRERIVLSWNVGSGSTLSLNPNLLYATSTSGAAIRHQPAYGLSLKLDF